MGKEEVQSMYETGKGNFTIDIKEIVQLSHEQLPIEEIEEMELVPQVESRDNGNEIEIIGYLYLCGEYRGNQGAGKLDSADELPESYEESVQFEPLSSDRGPFSPLARQDQFQYRIPVQISLPRGRVKDVDQVFAVIQSFDYELKSPYQIEVVASLVISGLMDQEEETIKPLTLGEQFEFVHMAGQGEQQPPDPFAARLGAIEEQASSTEKEEEEEREYQQDTWLEFETAEQSRNEPEQEVSIEERIEEKEEFDNVVPLPHLHEIQDERADEVEEEEDEEEEAVEEAEVEEEVRVAISNKGTKKDHEPISSLASIFSRIPKKEEVVQETSDHRSEEVEAEEDNEALYLTNFMENEEERFTKVKICIIQRNETIEEIADRYEMSVESILRANGAARNQVGSGQLLYIPVKG